jgi:hypothetical protein
MKDVRAPYMHWAKQHRRARWDLCGSNLLPCTLEDLPEAAEAMQLNGPNDEGYPPLVEAIARRYGVDAGRVAMGTGTSGANFLVCAALLDAGDDVLVETPGYDPLVAAPTLLGARVLRFARRFEDLFALDPALVARAVTDRTRLIIITNLHNPSGVLASQAAIEEVGRIAERVGAHVLVDEVYLDATFGSPDASRCPAGTLGGVFISTSSLTKAYGLSGFRCGWSLSSPEVAERVRRARDIVDGVGAFPPDRFSVVAFEHLPRLAARAHSILEPQFAATREFLDSRPEFEYVAPAGGTVVFPRLRGQADAGLLVERLFREAEVGVVPGRFFEAPAHVRLAFGGAGETVRGGLEAMGTWFERRAGL